MLIAHRVQHILFKFVSVVWLVALVHYVRHFLNLHLVDLLVKNASGRIDVLVDLGMQKVLKEVIVVSNFEVLRDLTLHIIEN